ncbi:hypothetical protein D9R06_02505 [Kocuria marina subsp. indica]|nr:hypothetical protein D9R06_02505 [Kocuria indica]
MRRTPAVSTLPPTPTPTPTPPVPGPRRRARRRRPGNDRDGAAAHAATHAACLPRGRRRVRA